MVGGCDRGQRFLRTGRARGLGRRRCRSSSNRLGCRRPLRQRRETGSGEATAEVLVLLLGGRAVEARQERFHHARDGDDDDGDNDDEGEEEMRMRMMMVMSGTTSLAMTADEARVSVFSAAEGGPG